MKIVRVLLDGRIAGPQIQFLEESIALRNGHNVESVFFIPAQESDEFRSKLELSGMKFITLSLHRLSKSPILILKWLFRFNKEVKELKRAIEEQKPDMVHCIGSWQWKGVIAGKKADSKVVWHLNDTKIPLLIRMVFRYLSRCADAFIVQGNRVVSYYLKGLRYPTPSYMLSAPVDTKKFDPEKFGKIKKDTNSIKIITVGNVNPAKGMEYFIEAASILNKKYTNLKFEIIGSKFESQDKYIAFLKKRVEKLGVNNLSFIGYDSEIPAVLASADIYICSSVTEASPISVWEAMSMGKAVVSTDVGAVSEMIIDGKSGFIVDVGDSEKMAEKIALLIENPELRMEFGKKVRKTAKEKLEVRIIAEKHFNIYRKIINEEQ